MEIVQDKAHPQRLAAAREILERDGRIGVISEAMEKSGDTFVLNILPAGQQRPAIEIQPELEPGSQPELEPGSQVKAVVRRV